MRQEFARCRQSVVRVTECKTHLETDVHVRADKFHFRATDVNVPPDILKATEYAKYVRTPKFRTRQTLLAFVRADTLKPRANVLNVPRTEWQTSRPTPASVQEGNLTSTGSAWHVRATKCPMKRETDANVRGDSMSFHSAAP